MTDEQEREMVNLVLDKLVQLLWHERDMLAPETLERYARDIAALVIARAMKIALEAP